MSYKLNLKKKIWFSIFCSLFPSILLQPSHACLHPLRWSMLQLRACPPACVYFWKLTTWPTCALLLLVHHNSCWPNKGSLIRNVEKETRSFDRSVKHSNRAFVWINHAFCGGLLWHNWDISWRYSSRDHHQHNPPLSPLTHHLMMMAIWNICFLKKGTESSLQQKEGEKMKGIERFEAFEKCDFVCSGREGGRDRFKRLENLMNNVTFDENTCAWLIYMWFDAD